MNSGCSEKLEDAKMRFSKSAPIMFAASIIGLLCCFSSCKNNTEGSNISILKDETCFFSYEIIDNQVIIKCRYTLINRTDEEKKIQLEGNFSSDKKLGLLVENILLAQYSTEDSNTVFTLKPGKTSINLCYVGTFAGTNEKTNRLIPDTKIIVCQDDPKE